MFKHNITYRPLLIKTFSILLAIGLVVFSGFQDISVLNVPGNYLVELVDTPPLKDTQNYSLQFPFYGKSSTNNFRLFTEIPFQTYLRNYNHILKNKWQLYKRSFCSIFTTSYLQVFYTIVLSFTSEEIFPPNFNLSK